MKKDSNYSLANVTSNFLKIVIHTEAHSNSTLLCHEPSAPESLSSFWLSGHPAVPGSSRISAANWADATNL